MGGVTGDFGKLARLIASMRRLSGVDDEIATAAVDGLSAANAETFNAGQDPYGDKWGGGYTFIKTGKLQAGMSNMKAKGHRVAIALPDHARYQGWRSGTSGLPLFFPNRGSLPDTWKAVIKLATEEIVGEVMGQ